MTSKILVVVCPSPVFKLVQQKFNRYFPVRHEPTSSPYCRIDIIAREGDGSSNRVTVCSFESRDIIADNGRIMKELFWLKYSSLFQVNIVPRSIQRFQQRNRNSYD